MISPFAKLPLSLPRQEPSVKRLRTMKRMTIAIGILASDGVVLAADREESDGYLKNDTGKVSLTFKGTAPVGTIGVTGAGSGAYLDEIARLISDCFCEEQIGDETSVKELIRKTHRKYYKEAVLPFPREDRPDYDLLIGCSGDNLGRKLWKTSGLAINPVRDYDAVGAGSTVANRLLGELWDNIPCKYAIKLAAYVIYQVKASVKDCGLGTDIVIVRRPVGFSLESVPAPVVREWEGIFRSYASLERNAFYYCIGLDTQPMRLHRTTLGKEPIEQQLEQFRTALTRLDSSWPVSTWPVGGPAAGRSADGTETKPSTAEKSEGQQ
jgi:20S proteasome alpha/beta subunit